MLSATPNEGQYSGNTLNVDLGGGGQAYIYIYVYTYMCVCIHTHDAIYGHAFLNSSFGPSNSGFVFVLPCVEKYAVPRPCSVGLPPNYVPVTHPSTIFI